MDIPSLKKFMLRNYEKIPGSSDFEYHKLILITAAGMVCGTPVAEEDNDQEVGFLIQKNRDMYHAYKDQYRDVLPTSGDVLVGNDGYIMLKDVTIMANNQNTRLSSLVVFFDEIIGVTVGLME